MPRAVPNGRSFLGWGTGTASLTFPNSPCDTWTLASSRPSVGKRRTNSRLLLGMRRHMPMPAYLNRAATEHTVPGPLSRAVFMHFAIFRPCSSQTIVRHASVAGSTAP